MIRRERSRKRSMPHYSLCFPIRTVFSRTTPSYVARVDETRRGGRVGVQIHLLTDLCRRRLVPNAVVGIYEGPIPFAHPSYTCKAWQENKPLGNTFLLRTDSKCRHRGKIGIVLFTPLWKNYVVLFTKSVSRYPWGFETSDSSVFDHFMETVITYATSRANHQFQRGMSVEVVR